MIWDRRNRSTLVRVVPGRLTTACSYSVIECGVPKGTVLGSILPLLYVAALQLLLKIVVFIHISLLTTLRSTGSAHHRRFHARNYRAVFLSVSMLLPAGCDHTGSSSTLPNRNYLANHWSPFASVATTTSSSRL